MVHKKEEATYHRIEKLTKEMPGFLSQGRGLPLLLIPEYSGINKEQRIPERSKQHTGSLLLNASGQFGMRLTFELEDCLKQIAVFNVDEPHPID